MDEVPSAFLLHADAAKPHIERFAKHRDGLFAGDCYIDCLARSMCARALFANFNRVIATAIAAVDQETGTDIVP